MENMIINHDFRYSDTLRINFNVPVGISSYGFDNEKELLDFYNSYNNADIYTFKLLQKCLTLENEINNILTESLIICSDDGYFELDWRDDLELEIHGIDQDKFEESMIEEINLKLEELLKSEEIK
jgi:hypothetical protein